MVHQVRIWCVRPCCPEFAERDSESNWGIRDLLFDVVLDERATGDWIWSAPEGPQPCGRHLGLLYCERVDVAHHVSFSARPLSTPPFRQALPSVAHAVGYAGRRIGIKRISTR